MNRTILFPASVIVVLTLALSALNVSLADEQPAENPGRLTIDHNFKPRQEDVQPVVLSRIIPDRTP
jgi:hypothetical protein